MLSAAIEDAMKVSCRWRLQFRNPPNVRFASKAPPVLTRTSATPVHMGARLFLTTKIDPTDRPDTGHL